MKEGKEDNEQEEEDNDLIFFSDLIINNKYKL